MRCLCCRRQNLMGDRLAMRRQQTQQLHRLKFKIRNFKNGVKNAMFQVCGINNNNLFSCFSVASRRNNTVFAIIRKKIFILQGLTWMSIRVFPV